MKKRATVSKSEPPASAGGSERRKPTKGSTTPHPSREFIRSLRSKYKRSGLMEELMEEKNANENSELTSIASTANVQYSYPHET